jgi:hypothetical protein
MEDDGMMAIIGWFFTVATVIWTIFLLMVGTVMIHTLLKMIF